MQKTIRKLSKVFREKKTKLAKAEIYDNTKAKSDVKPVMLGIELSFFKIKKENNRRLNWVNQALLSGRCHKPIMEPGGHSCYVRLEEAVAGSRLYQIYCCLFTSFSFVTLFISTIDYFQKTFNLAD